MGKGNGKDKGKGKNKDKGKGKKGKDKDKKGGGKNSGKDKNGSKNSGKGKNSSSGMKENAGGNGSLIRSMFPAVGTIIGADEAFGALVDSSAGIQEVCVQLKDHNGDLSDCYDTPLVSGDIYEMTFDGFDTYEGRTWFYRVRVKDDANNRETSAWAEFIINDSGSSTESSSGGSSSSGSSSSSTSGTSLTTQVNDASWPYGGEFDALLFFCTKCCFPNHV